MLTTVGFPLKLGESSLGYYRGLVIFLSCWKLFQHLSILYLLSYPFTHQHLHHIPISSFPLVKVIVSCLE